jgi:RNA polymerase-binding protein DksA
MNIADREFKNYLISKQEELSHRLEQLKQQASREDNPIPADFEEQAVEREGEDVLEEVKRLAIAELNEIKIALERLKAGTYGVCAECGDDIPVARLKVIPMAKYCTDCQSDLDEKNK